MRCSRCGLREATGELLKQHRDRIEKIYLCSECAKEAGIELGDVSIVKFVARAPMGLVNSGLLIVPTTRDAVCPECKTKASEFIKKGYVGCPKCYSVFEPIVAQTVRKLQHSDRHVGKNPYARPNATDEAAWLKSELNAAFAANDYGKVAEYSARLSALGINGDGGDK